MKTLLIRFRLAALTALLPVTLSAQSAIWTNAGGDFSFSNSANWSPSGSPGWGANLVLATDDFVGLDVGGDFLANSLTIASGVSGWFLPAGVETLSLGTGGIVNDGLGVKFDLPVLAVSSQHWHLGGGALTLGSNFNVLAGSALTITLNEGAMFDFGMHSADPTWEGTINFVGDVTGATIAVSGLGFSLENLSQITINGGAVQFNDGMINSAVPEPSTYGLFAAACLGFAAYRRRRRA